MKKIIIVSFPDKYVEKLTSIVNKSFDHSEIKKMYTYFQFFQSYKESVAEESIPRERDVAVLPYPISVNAPAVEKLRVGMKYVRQNFPVPPDSLIDVMFDRIKKGLKTGELPAYN